MSGTAVEVVCVQASRSVCPTTTTGSPPTVAPLTLSCPGMVNWSWYIRRSTLHGRCGLASTMPVPATVASRPSAQPLLPVGVGWSASPGRARLPAGAAGAGPVPDGTAVAISARKALAPLRPAIWYARRHRSSSVIGRTQPAPRQVGSGRFATPWRARYASTPAAYPRIRSRARGEGPSGCGRARTDSTTPEPFRAA